MTYIYAPGGSLPMLCRCADCKQDILDDFYVKAGFWWEEVVRRAVVCVLCREPDCPAARTCRGYVKCPNAQLPRTTTTQQLIQSPYALTIPEDR